MKKYSVGLRKFSTEFDDNTVTMKIKPLTVPVFMRVMPLLQTIGGRGPDVKPEDINPEDMDAIVSFSTDVKGFIDEFVTDIEGIELDGNASPKASELCDHMVFSALIVVIISQLVTIASITKGDEKNSEGESTQPQSAE